MHLFVCNATSAVRELRTVQCIAAHIGAPSRTSEHIWEQQSTLPAQRWTVKSVGRPRTRAAPHPTSGLRAPATMRGNHHHLLSLSAMKWRCHNCPLGGLSRESRLKRFLWLKKKMTSNYLVPNSKLAQGNVTLVTYTASGSHWIHMKKNPTQN